MKTLYDVYNEIQLTKPETWSAMVHTKTLEAFRRLERLLEQPLTGLPACPTKVDAVIKDRLHWRTAGFASEAAYRDFRGRIKRAISASQAGKDGMPTYTRYKNYSHAWQPLIADLHAAKKSGECPPWTHKSIARITGYANWVGLTPDQVDSAMFAQLLGSHAEVKSATKISIDSARSWNRLLILQATERPWWLRHLPDSLAELQWFNRRKLINPPETTWPGSLQADLAELVGRLGAPKRIEDLKGADRLMDIASGKLRDVILPSEVLIAESGKWKRLRKVASSATIKNYVWALRQTVGALVRTGEVNLSDLKSIDDLLTVEAIATSLTDYETRLYQDLDQASRPASQWQLATALGTIARHWGNPSAVELGLVSEMRAACRSDSCGTMAQDRRKLLWQFDEAQNLMTWFAQPDRLVRRAEANRRQGKISASDISDIETAIICRLVSVLPARRANLVSIRISGPDRHLVLARHGQETSWLTWPASEVKNKQLLRAPLDGITTSLIQRYLTYYRPRYLDLTKTPDSDALFPGLVSDQWGEGHRFFSSIGNSFTVRMAEVGLVMTLHLARHLAAQIMLSYDPKLLPVVADLLGDSEETVRKFYVTGHTERASAAYRDIIAQKAKELSLDWLATGGKEAAHG